MVCPGEMCHMGPYVPVNLAGYPAMIRVVNVDNAHCVVRWQALAPAMCMFILSILPIHPIITYKFYLVYVY